MIASHKELEQTKHKYDTGRYESDGADDRRTPATQPATVVSDTTYATAVASVHLIYYLIYLITSFYTYPYHLKYLAE